MAIKVTGLITPNSGSFAIEAQHVAFTYGEQGASAKSVQEAIEEIIEDIDDLQSAGGGAGGDASTIIYQGQQTIKQKIEALEAGLGTTADHISYSYTVDNDGTEETVTTNVKAVLDQLRNAVNGLNQIDNKVNEARGYATAAASAATTAQTAQLTITSSINEKLSQMTEMNNSVESKSRIINQRYDGLENIASQLQSVFEVDGQFVVISNAEYQRRLLETYDEQEGTGIAPNTIYLCYDEPPTGASTYELQLTVDPQHTSWGQVIGQGAYAQGTQVFAVGLPRSGYEFDHWHDDNTDNPRVIKMNSDLQYIAYFREATSNQTP